MNHTILKTVILDQHVVIQNSVISPRTYSFEENGNYILVGLRRAGKSTLLYQRVRDLVAGGVDWTQIIYINFEDERLSEFSMNDFQDIVEVQSELSEKPGYYFFDEIQNVDGWEKFVRRLRDSGARVFVTGSNAKLLSKDIATEFAGRGDEIHMYPLSFAEFMSVYKGDKYMGLSEYMLYGGIPLVVQREDANDKASVLQNLFSEIYIQDICKRNKIRNVGELEDLLSILSSAIGSLTNPEKLRNTFKTVKKSKITPKTIKKYLDYFEDSFLIASALRYDIKGKAYIETPKKYYFSDLGLRNARINFRQFEQTHSMENVIYNELRMRGYSVDVGVVPIAEKDKDGKVVRKALEVDFVCNLGSARYYIQSAYSLPDEAKRNQEIRPFRKIDDSFKKIVVTKDIVPTHYDENGILTVNIYEFLLNPGSIEG